MDEIAYEALRRRAEGSNVNARTLLATDYLNHFNEIVMLLEMLPDMPECLEDVQEWAPKSYPQHFADSAIADRELAIEAWPLSPIRYRQPFERTVQAMDQTVLACVDRCERAITEANETRLRAVSAKGAFTLQRFVERASAIINGDEASLDQHEIDALIDE